MATTKLPRYVRPRTLATGKTGYFWELPPWARPHKDPVTGEARPAVKHDRPCPVQSEALGTDLAHAIEKGEALNAVLDSWRKGEKAETVKGTVAWLFAWYRGQDRYKAKSAKTKRDYLRSMNMVAAVPMKVGTFGDRRAGAINATAADKIYQKLKGRGKRSASLAMQVCRLVWTWAARHHDKTGVSFNPFSKMGIETGAEKGNRPTTREEYDLYRETARELGFQSMATAAALSFEFCQRVWDVFGFVDPEGRKRRGFVWSDYLPGQSFSFVQSKTGASVILPLYDTVEGERVALYPDLEEELRRTPRAAIAIVVEERNGLPYTERRMSTVHRKICDKAGLPKDMTFTGFRHGGSTELGDADVADIRAITGHKELSTTRIYNKINERKARQIALKRRQYLAQLDSTTDEIVGTAVGISSEQKGGKGS